jgi:hypothetical protein
MAPGPVIPEPPDRSHLLSAALVVLAVLAVLVGIFDPGAPSRPSEPADRIAIDRADADAGFPKQPEPDNPPRGPGP